MTAVVPTLRAHVDPDAAHALGITNRHLDVLAGLAQGLNYTEIGRELYLSPDTVKSHARRLFAVLDVHDRAHAVTRGFELKVLVLREAG